MLADLALLAIHQHGNYRFLLWELIFGRPVVGRSTSHQIHQMVIWHHYFILTLRTHFWQTRCWQIYPPLNGNQFLFCNPYRFLLWELIFGRSSVGRSTPPSNGNFTDSCSTVHISFYSWELIFGRPVWADLPHISFPWELMADQVLADLLPIKWQFHRLLLW